MQRAHHGRSQILTFAVKKTLLQARRMAQDILRAKKRLRPAEIDLDLPIAAESKTGFWTDASIAERRLQLGKIQNLRIAVSRINGIKLGPGEEFSFWRQIGRATRRRGFAVGREVREGCIIPTIGGGLCQLSNALYDLALQTDCEVSERHPHTIAVPGSAAVSGRDATVFWNYIDLRFCPKQTCQIEAILTKDELILRFRTKPCAAIANSGIPAGDACGAVSLDALEQARAGIGGRDARCLGEPTNQASNSSKQKPVALRVIQTPGSCVTCGQDACARHAPELVWSGEETRTAYVLDAVTPEWQELLAEVTTERKNQIIIPIEGKKWRMRRYAWHTSTGSATFAALKRAWRARRFANAPPAILRREQLASDVMVARAMGKKIDPEADRIVVSQSLLPGLWQAGYLAGRNFEVLMVRLPMGELQDRLDRAFEANPDQKLLSDFRAEAALVKAEADALQAADTIVTPHPGIAALFPEKAKLVEWIQTPRTKQRVAEPAAARTAAQGSSSGLSTCLIFPGPTTARKGAYAVREVAEALDLPVLVLGKDLEGPDFWKGIEVLPAATWQDILRTDKAQTPPGGGAVSSSDFLGIVLLPSISEDRPVSLLTTRSLGFPIIATDMCGLKDGEYTKVAFGDTQAMVEAIGRLNNPTFEA